MDLKKKFHEVRDKANNNTEEKPKLPTFRYTHKSTGCNGGIDHKDADCRSLHYYRCTKCGAWLDKYTVLFGHS